MSKKIVGIVVLVLAVVAGWYLYSRPHTSASKGGSTQATNDILYICEGNKTIEVQFTAGLVTQPTNPGEPPIPGGSAKLTLDDGSVMTLAQTISADGARYANGDESFVFWSKGNGALVLQNGVEMDYKNCIEVAPEQAGQHFSGVYLNSKAGFTLRLPSLSNQTAQNALSYTVDSSYVYDQLGPGKTIPGVKFTIPVSYAQGTNLGEDTYLSVEVLPQTEDACSAKLYLTSPTSVGTTTNTTGTQYSVASEMGAGAGNRYEETVYARPYNKGCIGVRYYIHYSVFENYPPGSVREFDKSALVKEFDAILNALITE